MKNQFVLFPVLIIFLTFCTPPQKPFDDVISLANNRIEDLRLSVFITAHAVDRLLSSEAGRREAVSILRANGVTKVYVEVYRSGLVVSTDLLIIVNDFFRNNGFEVVGGIATVPGTDFGVRQEARYGWFNWQNEKTQKDLKKVMEDVAPVFDSFIIDDFLCTADTSIESKTAKGDKSWSQYRQDLLSDLSESLFIEPAKKINPEIRMIIKYPQWYDRFHLFGYDVARQPEKFDEVWVGTETRDQNTQRFGYVQPYEGFVNYRWLASITGDKIGGAWFDHIECSDVDFIDQAYQSVLAGAKELTLFNYFNFTDGHPGHHLLRMEFEKLADLAKSINTSPVYGVSAYKPANSDAGGDLYIMDFLGMYGIPIIPVSSYPDTAKVIFLPTQAASDPDIFTKVKNSLEKGARIICTSGFLARADKGEELAVLADLNWPINVSPVKTNTIIIDGHEQQMEFGLDMEAILTTESGNVLLEALVDTQNVPFFLKNKNENIFILNTHTFSQADFDAVGEVLLCPRPLGMLDIPEKWVNTIRNVFNSRLGFKMESPTRVTYQPFGINECMIQNYNEKKVKVNIDFKDSKELINVFTGQKLHVNEGNATIELPARSRIWVKSHE